MTTAYTYPSKSAWRRAFNKRREGYMLANERYIEAAPYEAPSRIRTPYSASEWLDLTPEERRRHVHAQAKTFVLSKMPPAPEPATLTLSQLERLVIQHADRRTEDLRATLKGSRAQIEAIVEAQRSAFRAAAFEQLTNTHRIIEG